MRLKKAIYAAVGLGLADVLTTYVALSRDFAEVNPLFAGSPWAAVWANVIMAAVVLALGGAAARAVKMFNVERHVLAMFAVFAATRTTVVVSNVLIPAGVIRRRCRPSRCSYQCR
ncbi:hypothetical protein Pisl_1278 [Pyrobaculum islandicum DSM 4184]|uniref:DUF5658 domain-containing protein n=1 Tax=Pyrobaculum islandicum (strain DSM 4184 / JCM 9189 / GEO3) TaxID=384616 RepID=A1RU10_PYRIL|nr:DUF5658 family protein [Pyrobaculum islandicum]ABL88442.1 hypothetical protein Pisl_1278 [Pyrobaculum islandicum DSM 4184]